MNKASGRTLGAISDVVLTSDRASLHAPQKDEGGAPGDAPAVRQGLRKLVARGRPRAT